MNDPLRFRHSKQVSRTLGGLIVIVLYASTGLAGSLSSQTPGGVVLGPPAREINPYIDEWGNRVTVKVPTNRSEVVGLATADTGGRTVRVTWRRENSNPDPTAPKQATVAVGAQAFATSFWPTEVAPFGTGKLLVAGKRPKTFATLIELWEFSELEALDELVLDPHGGGVLSKKVRLTVARSVVYEEAIAERDVVQAMLVNEGSGKAFVQFFSSRDFYEIDVLGEDPPQLVMRSQVSVVNPSLPYYPTLRTYFKSRYSLDSAQHGYLYVLGRGGDKGDAGFAFVDGDRDGVIDAVHPILNVTKWVELNLGSKADTVSSRYF